MGKAPSNLITNLQERLEFFSEIGLDHLYSSNVAELNKITSEILQCQACPLAQTRKNAVPGEGNFQAELMFVGEGPGFEEDMQGRPFVGKAGQLLTRIINAMNFARDDVYITNLVKCRPPENRNPNAAEIEQCRHFLSRQIELIAPRVIVSLGNVPTHFFLDTRTGITALRGRFNEYGNVKIMPTFHPSYLVRQESNRELRRQVWEDMKKVMAFLGKK